MTRVARLVLAVLALSACASMENTVVAEPGVGFSLPLGSVAELRGSGTQLAFKRVTEESRCPTSVTCVWAGDAKIEITLSRQGGAEESRILSLTPPNNEAQIGNLVVRFVGLAPYPATPEPNAPRRYVAELVIRSI
ncbi:MAG TPA: hypothetical protein VNO75_03220 [Gemmatimonadaceae bacterium]|nr:hypothetical protein [Gemmatimonadaceae bacterium]